MTVDYIPFHSKNLYHDKILYNYDLISIQPRMTETLQIKFNSIPSKDKILSNASSRYPLQTSETQLVILYDKNTAIWGRDMNRLDSAID